MKVSEKEKLLFDYMQEQANNLFDFCERNGIDLVNPGFFVDPSTGFAYVSATRRGTLYSNEVLLNLLKQCEANGGRWDTEITTVVMGEENEE